MPAGRSSSLISGALPVIIVIALSTIIAVAIAAWLIREVASRAIEKTKPEDVASVVVALGALLNPLRLFLPWSGHKCPTELTDPGGSGRVSPHNDPNSSPESPQGKQS
jgi:hypothetical protein